MSEGRDTKSLLTIKVLRLVRPNLIGPLALSGDSHDLPGDLWERELKSDVTSVPGIEALSLGKFLRLPQGFGNMYLGETFSSYVCIQNESPTVVTNVSCKVELQTNTQKFVLSDDRTMSEIKTGSTLDIVMHHEVKEMGKHMLICTLTYTVPGAISAEPVTLERFFRFQVKKPLDVKTKLYNAENDEVFLEAQVQNITSSAICLERISLEPSSCFSCTPLTSTVDEFDSIKKVSLGSLPKLPLQPMRSNVMLDVENSQQFLYRLSPIADNARSATNIGKLDIVWRTSLGDKGRLQTSQLQRQPPVLNDLKFSVDKMPSICTVDVPFDVTCKLTNTTSEREMDLQLELESPSTDGYVWLGITRTKIGPLAPSSSREMNLAIFPTRMGLINLSGIRIVDLNRGEKFSYNDVVQVLIMNENLQPSQ
ncbi:unnamed protein product [Allacma fusca]|uniref:Trafficking protein particle complex subunit 13 n=1 Tax=Allacma fusca TaxID=39272 RepID=A0A8J2PV64_9HEXA|nr:unnamed protein product [Allacma fusca]